MWQPVYTYRNHYCEGIHTTGKQFARCLWSAADITGDGDYAVVSRCSGVVRKVWLFRALAYAEMANDIHQTSCGPACDQRKHQVVMFMTYTKEARTC